MSRGGLVSRDDGGRALFPYLRFIYEHEQAEDKVQESAQERKSGERSYQRPVATAVNW